jgi:hypothetical protein
MASGYLLQASQYLGGASGNLFSTFYVPGVNTNGGGALEGIGVVASLAADAPAVIQFICPNPVPSGTPKLRSLFQANATSGVAKYTVQDGATSPNSNPGTTTLTSETQQSLTWTTADILVENKVTLTGLGTLSAGQLITTVITFNTTGWTLAAVLSGAHMLVWE